MRKTISRNSSERADAALAVGILKLCLWIPENHSLKGKRGVLKSIQSRVANKFNVSATECGVQELWQSAVLGFGMVGSNRRIVEAALREIIDFVDAMKLAEVAKAEVESFYY